MAFGLVEPFGPDREDQRAGFICAAIAATKGVSLNPFLIMPAFGKISMQENREQTVEEQINMARVLTEQIRAAFAEVEKEKDNGESRHN